MSIPKRHNSPPGTYFVTSRTWESRRIFIRETACIIFVEMLLHYREDGAFALHAFTLMPDHFHLLLTPMEDKTIERVMQYVKGGSAHAIREKLNISFPIWQRGFSDHRIRSLGDFEGHVQYIERNPVERRLSATPQDYPWSSASGRYRLDRLPQRLKPRDVIKGDAPSGTAQAVP